MKEFNINELRQYIDIDKLSTPRIADKLISNCVTIKKYVVKHCPELLDQLLANGKVTARRRIYLGRELVEYLLVKKGLSVNQACLGLKVSVVTLRRILREDFPDLIDIAEDNGARRMSENPALTAIKYKGLRG